MRTLRVSEARTNLYKLVDEASQSHAPVKITGKHGNAIIISEDDWKAVEETLYLLSVPGMRESIVKGMKTPIKECTDNLKW
jgi:prevent-host-death family protein